MLLAVVLAPLPSGRRVGGCGDVKRRRRRSSASRKEDSSRQRERQKPLSRARLWKPRETSCRAVISRGSRTGSGKRQLAGLGLLGGVLLNCLRLKIRFLLDLHDRMWSRISPGRSERPAIAGAGGGQGS
jgi:hypothetical protein